MSSMISFSLTRFAALLGATVVSAASKPNVILLVVDDLGFADLSLKGTVNRTAGGYALDYSTPEIDSLASEGMLLDAYYVNRLCSPTRTSLISSRYAYNLGLAGGVITNGFPVGLRLNETCIAQHMKDIGYQTHAFGKWDVGYHTWGHTPTMRGFDSWLGYYDADEDYLTHTTGGGKCGRGLDLRNGTNVLHDSSTYSTALYTTEGVRVINDHDPSKGPFFLYAAYQAVHGPLEAPQKYLDQCNGISEVERHIFCGMVLALDEGVGKITAALKANGLLDNTIIAFTTDNGGQNYVGGNNWPLRGNKATVFEGGVRGQGFIWGGKATALGVANADNAGSRGHLFPGLMHNVDWGPTLYSAGGGDASKIITAHKLDGLDMWPSFLQTAAGSEFTSTVGPRQDVLLHLQGMDMGSLQMETVHMTAALRMGDWKVVVRQEESNCPATMQNASSQRFLKMASGWVQLHKDKHTGLWASRSFEKPTFRQTCDDRTCLFNLKSDPYERVDVSAAHPDVLAKLLGRINDYNRTLVPSQKWPFDDKSCPYNFPSNAWTPWLNNTPPVPEPTPMGITKFHVAQCRMDGWCSGPNYSGPPLNVRIMLDGAEVASTTASVHRHVAGDHGFVAHLDCTKIAMGEHKIEADALYAGSWVTLKGTPVCILNGKVVMCKSQVEDAQPTWV